MTEQLGPTPERRERIANRRQDLYEVMQQIEASAARPSGTDNWRRHLDGALASLEEALRRHTSEIEAEDGLFDDVSVRTPNLVPIVDDLRREHAAMSAQCSEARGLVGRSEVSINAVRAAVVELLGQLVVHRQRGAELLYDSYNLELAAGD